MSTVEALIVWSKFIAACVCGIVGIYLLIREKSK